ncbi:SEC-C metal-binding domain-containing protein [Desulfobacula sp.]|uniref:SEC-C metal-binding domain-containing protein n=1 Tax=Desulfobacula sp. TaxID=2593537 RepID=UPI0025C1442B|nr:SEC-C metal-binding domain-containing protein [Desulfobacula sp.]
MKIGRNDSCPCGSGKKYKKCCLNKSNIIPAIDLAYRRISKAYEELEPKLEKYMLKHFNSEIIEDALHEFFCWPDEEDEYFTDDAMDSLQDLYRPWILYNWDCKPDLDEAWAEEESEITIAEAYMKENIKKISNLEKKLVKGISRKPYCFWDVMGVKPGQSIDLKNIMTGKTVTVQEHMGSGYLNPKNIVFARAVVIDNIDMLIGMGRAIIPTGLKPALIELRKDIKEGRLLITDEDLLEWDMDLREAYLDIDHHLHNPPKMQNIDGELLEFHKLVFEIKDPDSAFEKLASLCTVESPETIRKTAESDKKGRISKVNFSWTKKGNKKIQHYDNTILGEVRIDHKKMIIQINSAQRAERICKEIKTRMGSDAKFKVDVIEDMDPIMNHPDEDSFDHKKFEGEHDALMKNPEIQQQLKQMLSKHWDNWVDMKIPALGNITPRTAVKTADGREAVEALLYDIETGKTPDPVLNELHRKGVQKVKKELGLD